MTFTEESKPFNQMIIIFSGIVSISEATDAVSSIVKDVLDLGPYIGVEHVSIEDSGENHTGGAVITFRNCGTDLYDPTPVGDFGMWSWDWRRAKLMTIFHSVDTEFRSKLELAGPFMVWYSISQKEAK